MMTNRSKEEMGPLKPCPFCGERAIQKNIGNYWPVSCRGKDCCAYQSGKSPKDSRNLWNRRSP